MHLPAVCGTHQSTNPRPVYVRASRVPVAASLNHHCRSWPSSTCSSPVSKFCLLDTRHSRQANIEASPPFPSSATTGYVSPGRGRQVCRRQCENSFFGHSSSTPSQEIATPADARVVQHWRMRSDYRPFVKGGAFPTMAGAPIAQSPRLFPLECHRCDRSVSPASPSKCWARADDLAQAGPRFSGRSRRLPQRKAAMCSMIPQRYEYETFGAQHHPSRNVATALRPTPARANSDSNPETKTT
ncbi:hypothetical protein Mesau_05894 [Mesorhizobium australicum WSM2073]|uniref:Uncharacterized protein n=3 Tax=Mesorhizobium TaxID=68287 RepID=L0KSN2_MESAW|nr:hypothetical protein Mesci_5847 [Mesorhizobium ciceri biovar biserrulae WSM1271]AEH90756.1 hypothetical protein Mesop_6421 [Mesorhizobium opportunistum WSM2075]AGB48126.1 hypothetical protein Mesau_05894 [Mesorhizobium australicum WSM2073]